MVDVVVAECDLVFLTSCIAKVSMEQLSGSRKIYPRYAESSPTTDCCQVHLSQHAMLSQFCHLICLPVNARCCTCRDTMGRNAPTLDCTAITCAFPAPVHESCRHPRT